MAVLLDQKQSVDKCLSSVLPGTRIARISTVPFFVVTQLKNQIKALGEFGAKVTVVCSDGPEVASLMGLKGVDCVTIDIPRRISPLRDFVALIRLFIFFKRERIEIAHSVTPKAGLLTAIAARFAGVPIRIHTFTGQPWVNMVGLKRWLVRSSDRLVVKLNTRCYTDSLSQRQFLIEEGIVTGDCLGVIGLGSIAGVDIKRFSCDHFSSNDNMLMRQKLHIPDDSPVLLFIGRITEDKGIRELMGAFSLIKKARVAPHLILVGPFDEDSGVSTGISQDEIVNFPNVHLVGYSSCPESYLAIADILCLPSYREGFGTVVIEAAAMSVPAIGTDIYGLSDAIVDGETGLIVPVRDVQGLLKAIEKLLENKQLRVQMGKTAKRRTQTDFDSKVISKLLAKEYCMLLKKI